MIIIIMIILGVFIHVYIFFFLLSVYRFFQMDHKSFMKWTLGINILIDFIL